MGSDGTLSQTISTIAGAQYAFSFWFASVGDDPSDFSVLWDGVPLLSLSNPNIGADWTLYAFTVTATGQDTLTLSFRDDPAYMAVDNIAITEFQPTAPEPSSFLLLGTGVLGLGGIVRRKLNR